MDSGVDLDDVFTARLQGGKPWGFTVKEVFPEDCHQPCLEISKVEPSGRAHGHFEVGDILLAIDGVPCHTVDEAKLLMSGTNLQGKLSLTLSRHKKTPTDNAATAITTTHQVAVEVHEINSADDYVNLPGISAPPLTKDNEILEPAAAPVAEETHLEPQPDSSNVTMDLAAPETMKDASRSALLNSSSTGQRGNECSPQQSATFYDHPNNPQFDIQGHFDKSSLSAVPSSRFNRYSMDPSYQTCGLPSGTLYRKTAGKRTSFAEPLVTGPSTSNQMPTGFNPARRGSASNENIDQRSPSFAPTTPMRNATRPQNAPSVSGSASNRLSYHGPSTNGYIYRATPVSESYWAQTESSTIISKTTMTDDGHHQPGGNPTEPSRNDVVKMTGVLRTVPATSASTQPNRRSFCHDFSWDNGECSSGINSPRSSVASTPSLGSDPVNNVPVYRLKGRKSLTNTSNVSSSSDELDDYAALLAKRRSSESSTVMPTASVRLGTQSDEYNRAKNLTTINEVRTYQIRSNDNGLKTSSLHINAGSSSGNSSSASSTPDDFRHKRDASLDSSVSWQSSSTNSSGYSSVALSSSTPTLDMNASEETLIPVNSRLYRERSNTSEPLKAHSNDPSEDCSESGHRSLSVSEMVKTYSETSKIPPVVPPKPRYSFLPAQHSLDSSSKPSHRTPEIKQPPPYNVAVSANTSRWTSSNKESPLRATDSSIAVNPSMTPSKSADSLQIGPKKSALKTSPVYRTGLHGVTFDKAQSFPISEHEEITTTLVRSDSSHELPISATRESSSVAVIETQVIGESRNGSHSESPGRPNHEEDDLNNTKMELISRLTSKIALLKEEQQNIQEDLDLNEQAGEVLLNLLQRCAPSSDVEKYVHHLRELEQVISLRTSIKNRLSLVENSLSQLAQPGNELEAEALQTKRHKLAGQLEEVDYLESGILRRRKALQALLSEKYLDKQQFEDYMLYFKTKANLVEELRTVHHKTRMAEEQLIVLQRTSSMMS